jgi:uncharacterized protein (TIGR02001 family)
MSASRLIRRTGLPVACLAGVVLTGASANAADEIAGRPDAASMFDVAFGVDFTTDYIDRGYTQSNHKPAIQPWVELDYGKFYVGYWGSNTSPVDTDGNWEHDLSIGVRPEWGPFSFDLGYTRTIYDTGDCCGELYANASVSPVDPLTLGVSLNVDPAASDVYVEGNGSYDLPYNISISAAAGVQTYGNGDPSDFSWNAGASWSPLDWLSFDGRYYGGPMANRFVATMSLSSSLSAWRGEN